MRRWMRIVGVAIAGLAFAAAGVAASTLVPSHTRLLADLTKTTGCTVSGGLPDRGCTPGAIYADATVRIICAKGYEASADRVSKSTKDLVFTKYGLEPGAHTGTYEIDHLVPLTLGGSNDIANLWPEAAGSPASFRKKDALETRLSRSLVCKGLRPLRPTQTAIAKSWIALYAQLYHRQP